MEQTLIPLTLIIFHMLKTMCNANINLRLSCVIFRFLMPYKLNLLLILWKQISILLFYFPGTVLFFSFLEFVVCTEFLLRFAVNYVCEPRSDISTFLLQLC